MKTELLDRTDLAPAASRFANACRASRHWSHKLAVLRDRYKVPAHAPHVSGCGVAQATDEEKDEMRALAETVSRESAAAYALRPPRVRESTMRALASAVARSVGSGFYGPQPDPVPRNPQTDEPPQTFHQFQDSVAAEWRAAGYEFDFGDVAASATPQRWHEEQLAPFAAAGGVFPLPVCRSIAENGIHRLDHFAKNYPGSVPGHVLLCCGRVAPEKGLLD